MSKNIIMNGEVFEDVSTVNVPKEGGGVATFEDIDEKNYATEEELAAAVEGLATEQFVEEKIAEIPEPVASWNDLQDKPFGDTYGFVPWFDNETVTIKESTTDDGETYYTGLSKLDQDHYNIEIGEKIVVIWDGVEYECEITGAGGAAYGFGNFSLSPRYGEGDDVEYPNLPLYGLIGGTSTTIYVAADAVGEHTLSVGVYGTVTNTLDERFIPDSIARLAIVPYSTLKVLASHDEELNFTNTQIGNASCYTDLKTYEFGSVISGTDILVNIDGVKYKCVRDIGFFGNYSLHPNYEEGDVVEYPDLPFVYVNGSKGYPTIYGNEELIGTHTFSIMATEGSAALTPEECIPDTVARLDAVPHSTLKRFVAWNGIVEVAPDTTHSGEECWTITIPISDILNEIKVGDVVEITWDGTTHNCVVRDFASGGNIHFGNYNINPSYVDGDVVEFPDIPIFAVGAKRDDYYVYTIYSTQDMVGVHELSIKARSMGEVVPVPEECIPETIQRVGDNVIIKSSTPNSTKLFKITVTDDGVVTATEVTV